MGNGHCKDCRAPGEYPSWVAVAIGGSAVIGGIASNQAARAANKPRNIHTDSTSTQNPYMADRLNPGIEEVLRLQGGLAQRGAPQLGPNGQIYYAPLPGQEGAGSSAPPPPTNGVGRPGRRGRGAAGKGPATWTNARGEVMTLDPSGKPIRATSGTAPGTASTPTGPDLGTPQGIFGEVARRGLNAGDTGTQSQARNVMGNIWGDAGGPGSAAGGEYTGFERYNPVLDRLTGTLEGDVNDRVGANLLLDFLNENNRGGAGGAGGGNGNGGGGGGGNVRFLPAGTSAAKAAMASNPAFAAGAGVPDTMVPESFFGTETRKIMDEQANEAELQSVIDAMNADVERGMFRDLAQLDAAAAGSGRFGGSTWAALNRDAREEALQEMTKTGSQVRMSDREARRQARLAALTGVNARDLGLLNANVQREGIAAGERAAGAGAAAASGAAADQIALAKRGQDLSAIGALLENERFSLGQLGDVGGQLSGDRLAALGMVPGLEGIGLNGLQMALGAGGGLTDMRGQDIGLRQAQIAAGVQRQGLAQQAGMFNAGQQQGLVNDYLRTLMGIGGMGGTATTRGTNVQPGAGVSTGAATAMGALGGGLSGAGMFIQGRQAGVW